MAVYGHIFDIKSEISSMETSVWGHAVLSEKFPEENIEIRKVKESRSSFPLSCFLCPLLEIMTLYVAPGAWNAPSLGSCREALKS